MVAVVVVAGRLQWEEALIMVLLGVMVEAE
jgi:hypothetical protein